jgi:chromosome partitioning protein
MGHIVAVAILKGGTAKTTTTLNLGAALAERGLRVLLIDSDHQCSLSRAAGIEPTDLDPDLTLYGAMQAYMARREARLERAIHATQAGVDLVPASVRLSRTNVELQHIPRREYVLQQLLAPIAPTYDVVLIDTMPTNNTLVFNALVAAESVLLPMEPEKLAVESLQLTLEDIATARETGLNPQLTVLGVVLTRVKKGRTLHREYSDQIRQVFGEELTIFNTVIYDSIRFPESQDRSKTVLHYEPDGVSAQAYRQLAAEVLHGWE